MGAHLWFYFVPYEPDISKALSSLREQEFQAGRYNPAVMFPHFPVEKSGFVSPGVQHGSIEQALEASGADGTRSILDVERVGREADYGVVTPLASTRMIEVFGTEQPTRGMIEENIDLCEGIERGQGIYIIVYKDGKPSELFFAGYSYD